MNNNENKTYPPLPDELKVRSRQTRWFVLKAMYGSIPYREKLVNAGFKIFLPTYFEMQKVGNRKVRVEKPSIMNYIFVNTKSDVLYEYVKYVAGLTIVYKHRPLHDEGEKDVDDWLLSIPDKQMEIFMRHIVHYDREVPFFKANEVELEKGDYVKIVGGDFEGVEGVLKTAQGKVGGKVLVAIGKVFMMQTLEIEPQYIQVIRFAKQGKHLYKNFDSFIEKGRTALEHFFNPIGVSMSDKIKDQTNMRQFIDRFCKLSTPTVNARLKLQVNLLICYTCLGEDDNQQKTIDMIMETLTEIKSEIYRAFALAILYRCTQDEQYKAQALKITKPWGKPKEKEKLKTDVLVDLGVMKKKDKDKKNKKGKKQ